MVKNCDINKENLESVSPGQAPQFSIREKELRSLRRQAVKERRRKKKKKKVLKGSKNWNCCHLESLNFAGRHESFRWLSPEKESIIYKQ